MFVSTKSRLAETTDHSAYTVLRYAVLAEQCEMKHGVVISGETLKKFALFGVPIMDPKKHHAASSVITEAMIRLAQALNGSILKHFTGISMTDLQPGVEIDYETVTVIRKDPS
jgi:hypothetical protein